MSRGVGVGLNLNNREPLLVASYPLGRLLDLGEAAEELGFDSVWVGDSLFSKPRHDPLVLLAALSQRTRRVRLGTACLVASMRDPLYLALAWTTLDVMSDGRMVLGACAGNAEEGVRREFEALGLNYRHRTSRFEETLTVLRHLWTDGKVSFEGEHLRYQDVAFASGTELQGFAPVQDPPPIWVVSNPRIGTVGDDERIQRRVDRAAARVVEHGDGWLTCCRARHPEDLEDQLARIGAIAARNGRDLEGFEVAYQVTMTVGDSREQARREQDEYIKAYYPEFGGKVDLDDWGPVGTPDDIAAWLRRFAQAGVTQFICRFAAEDQFGQAERFAREVLSGVKTERRAGEVTP